MKTERRGSTAGAAARATTSSELAPSAMSRDRRPLLPRLFPTEQTADEPAERREDTAGKADREVLRAGLQCLLLARRCVAVAHLIEQGYECGPRREHRK